MELVDFYNDLVTKEAELKLAHVLEEYKEEPETLEAFDKTLGLVKQAQEQGKIPALNPSEAISVAVQLVEEEKLAQASEDWEKIGEEVAELLSENFGITQEDIEKISSEEEADEFGRFCARLWATANTGENYLTE